MSKWYKLKMENKKAWVINPILLLSSFVTLYKLLNLFELK